MSARLRAPFPYYGSKIEAAALIERLMGPINNMVIPFAGSLGDGVHASQNRERLLEYFLALAARLRWVRITCGDWRRVTTPAVTTSHGLTGVSLDPPYDHALRSSRLYREDSPTLSADVRAWALEHGDDPLLRITLAGKGTEHDELLEHGWSRHEWRSDGEVIWSSPRCHAEQWGPMFEAVSA